MFTLSSHLASALLFVCVLPPYLCCQGFIVSVSDVDPHALTEAELLGIKRKRNGFAKLCSGSEDDDFSASDSEGDDEDGEREWVGRSNSYVFKRKKVEGGSGSNSGARQSSVTPKVTRMTVLPSSVGSQFPDLDEDSFGSKPPSSDPPPSPTPATHRCLAASVQITARGRRRANDDDSISGSTAVELEEQACSSPAVFPTAVDGTVGSIYDISSHGA